MQERAFEDWQEERQMKGAKGKGGFDPDAPPPDFKGLGVTEFVLSKTQFVRRQIRRLVVDQKPEESLEEANLGALRELIAIEAVALKAKIHEFRQKQIQKAIEEQMEWKGQGKGGGKWGGGNQVY